MINRTIEMIQRIQSIFLALASGTFFSQFGLSFATRNTQDQGYFQDLMYNIHDDIGLISLTVIGGLISFIAIFFFNNRKLQIRITYLAVICAILLPILAVVMFFQSGATFSDHEPSTTYRAGSFVPVVSIALLTLAARYINKDEKLVSDSNRLR